jgi:hypothetical protein
MAKNENRRLSPKVLKEDQDAHDAIDGLSDYDPSNPLYAKDKLAAKRTAMDGAQKTETQKDADAKGARDAANKAEWAFHNDLLEAKKQVSAQYGSDSDQVQAVGLKKKSEYKAPHRNGSPAPAPVR